jgi:hypothetical protein
MSRPFEITREIVLPSAPEDVWTAITTGTDAWQFPGGLPEPGEGSPTTAWDPPNHVAVRMEAPDGTFNALEYVIEARDGGTAVVRYVHSGILAEAWEDQYDAIGPHTDFYFHTLAQYLEHFRGRTATYVGQPSAGIEGPESAGADDAMTTLRAALGIDGAVQVGDRVNARLGDAGTVDGEVDYATDAFLGVRTADGLYRFFGRNRFGGVVGMSAHLFDGEVDAAQRERQLKAWLDGLYV